MSVHRHLGRDDGRLRTTRWRGDPSTAQLLAPRGRPSERALSTALEQLRAEGYTAAVTAALSPAEQAPFRAAGFVEHEQLHLLRRSVERPPRPSAPVPLRRARRDDLPAVLDVDGQAFQPFWRFDEGGLADAMAATPSARMRIAVEPGDRVVGYAITGRAGSRGYLQRLAVTPGVQRRGIGTALVADALRWLRRWGAREVLVNTQEHNTAALALYGALGFRQEPEGLTVLRRALAVDHR